MTDEYALDLYPRSDPRDGSRLARFTYEDLISAEYRDVIGVGSGKAVIWADHAGADQITADGEQYLRVVRLGGVEAVVGGIWTSKMPFEAAVRQETRRLTVSGPGQMAYLARAILAPHSYLDNTTVGVPGQDPFDDTIRFYLQGPLAGGNFLGAVLWRAVADFGSGSRVTNYTHVHSTEGDFGEIVTDNHADDRIVNRIPDLVLGFDQHEDSNGNAWTLSAGEFTAQVGDNLLSVVQSLMQRGLFVWMDPHTFTLYAWEGRPATKLGRSTDRTGAAWGANVVRFQAPTDATPATGNILSDASRIVNSNVKRGPLWVGGNDVYHKEPGPADALYEGFAHNDAADLDALEAFGEAQSSARSEAADVGQVHVKLGNDEATGYYRPGEHYRVDELVTIHTGTTEFDYDEASYPIGAWRISLPEGAAEWEAWPELGASYSEAERREFAVPARSGHSHPPQPDERLEYLQTHHRFLVEALYGDIGSDDSYPENTLEAYRQAAIKGADRIHINVHKSADGTWYCIRTNGVAATTDGTGNVSDKTDAQMDALNIDGGEGYDAGRHGTSLNVPTLTSVLTALRPYDVVAYICLQGSATATDADHGNVARVMEAAGWVPRTVIGCRSVAGATSVRSVDKRFRTATEPATSTVIGVASLDQQWDYNTNITSAAYCTARAPKQVTAGLTFPNVGTDESAVMEQMYDFGVRTWITQHLDLAIRVRSLMNGGTGPTDEADEPGSHRSALFPGSSLELVKDAANPTFNFDFIPKNVVKVGDTYYAVGQINNTSGTRAAGLATASDRDGPWTVYGGNPILTVGSQAWESAISNAGLSMAQIIEVEGVFYLFYSVEDVVAGSTGAIGLATATSITGPYTKSTANPILEPEASGWDSRSVTEATALYHDGRWLMMYMGQDDAVDWQESEKVGIASASDPEGPWTKSANNPVIDWGDSGEWDEALTADPHMFFENGYYWCWYTGGDPTPWMAGLAYSNDPLVEWTKHPDNPLLEPGAGGAWDDEGAWRGGIWVEEGLVGGVYGGFPTAGSLNNVKGGTFRLVVTAPGEALALDDLTDVTITSPEADQQLQYVGGVWVNNHRRWEPVTTNPGGGPEIVFFGDEIVMTWADYS